MLLEKIKYNWLERRTMIHSLWRADLEVEFDMTDKELVVTIMLAENAIPYTDPVWGVLAGRIKTFAITNSN